MLAILMLTSKGMAGVPRASLVVIAATLAQFDIPVAGLVLLLGVDHFLDMGRSATNVVGNSIATAVVARWEGELRHEGQPAPGPAARSCRRASRVLLDLSPLRRHRDFRLVFIGQLVSAFGSFFTYVAMPVQIYELTGSSAVVGLLGTAQLVPLAVAALWGGAFADAIDRRAVVAALRSADDRAARSRSS